MAAVAVAEEKDAAGGGRGTGSHGEQSSTGRGGQETTRPETVLGLVLDGPGCVSRWSRGSNTVRTSVDLLDSGPISRRYRTCPWLRPTEKEKKNPNTVILLLFSPTKRIVHTGFLISTPIFQRALL